MSGKPATDGAGPSAMNAELDVFSGRPNPQWELTGDEWTELRQRIAALPAASGSNPRTGLGYRGIVLTPRGDAAPFSRLVVAGGVVVAADAQGRERALEDTGRSLELWLLRLAQSRLGSDIRSLIDSIVAAEPGLGEHR